MILKGLVPVISFVLGIVFSYSFIEPYNGEVLELWQEAYSMGKLDGFEQGRYNVSIDDFSFVQKEAMCMFLYDHKKK